MTISVTVIGFICFLLSIWLGFRMKQSHVKLFALLCAVMSGYTGYSVIHTFVPVWSMLTYTLEIGSYYAMFLLIILLHNRICKLPRIWKTVNIDISVSACIAAILFSVCSRWIDIDGRSVFSAVLTVYKWGMAANLLAAAIYAIYNKIHFSKPLLYGTIFFAVSLLLDRIFPLYEPIYTGWFGEISGVVFVVILGYIIWSDITDAYSFNLIFTEQKRQMERQIVMQKEHYDMITDKIDETRKLRHDMRQHFRVMQGFLHKKSYDELYGYIAGIESSDYDLSPVILCSNNLIDVILQYYGTISNKRQIDFDAQFSAPKSLKISDGDLSVLLGNLLENAYEACAAVKSDSTQRIISIHGSCNEKNLKVRIKNTTDTIPKRHGNDFYSSKHEGTGIGLRSVRSVVEKYNGMMDVSFEENEFSVLILISFE